jgi:hypothetical protein
LGQPGKLYEQLVRWNREGRKERRKIRENEVKKKINNEWARKIEKLTFAYEDNINMNICSVLGASVNTHLHMLFLFRHVYSKKFNPHFFLK